MRLQWKIWTVFLGLAVAGCDDTARIPDTYFLPEQAVIGAASSPQGMSGTFAMTVRSVAWAEGKLFLDSEEDYRDPRNLSVVISPAVADALTERFGDKPEHYLLHRQIAVSGTAEKVQIVFVVNGRETSKYYFQTHLRLATPNHISIMK